MKHDEIVRAARERITEIDKETAALAVERAKLQAMLASPSETPTWISVRPSDAAAPPALDSCQFCRQQRWTFGGHTFCGCCASIECGDALSVGGGFRLHVAADDIVCGPGPSFDSSHRFAS